MADTTFTVKVDGRTFTLDRVTMGDWRMFKTAFGLNASDIASQRTTDTGETIEALNLDDPNVLIAMMVAALSHERPDEPIPVLIAEIEALSMDGFEFPGLDDPEGEVDPTRDGDGGNAETVAPGKSGKSGKRQRTPGTPN